jgi:hypothetical protein
MPGADNYLFLKNKIDIINALHGQKWPKHPVTEKKNCQLYP